MKPRYEKLQPAEEVELSRIETSDNSLLESFARSDLETSTEFHDAYDIHNPNLNPNLRDIGVDTRLLVEADNQGLGAANELQRNIHDAMIREGNSSHNDLEQLAETKPLEYRSENVTNNAEASTVSDTLGSDGNISRINFKHRASNFLKHIFSFRQTYDRLNNGISTGRMQSNRPGRFIGQGTDGVFRNLMAKPGSERSAEQELNPPSYEEAAADATPEYWEVSVFSPMYEDEVFVEGLPVGNTASFVWNILVTSAFQFVGFVLCYLLHTSHASKQGSRVGLGFSFIMYGYRLLPSNDGSADDVPTRIEPENPNDIDETKSSILKSGLLDTYKSTLKSSAKITEEDYKTPFIAYGVVAFGIFVAIKACIDYYRVLKMEKVILSTPSSQNTLVNSVTETQGTNETGNNPEEIV